MLKELKIFFRRLELLLVVNAIRKWNPEGITLNTTATGDPIYYSWAWTIEVNDRCTGKKSWWRE